MGFHPDKLQILQQRAHYGGPGWGDFALEELTVELDGALTRLVDSPVNLQFVPPPGWKDHIER